MHDNTLLSIGTITGVLYKMVEATSTFASLMLPIFSCMSFVLYIAVNRKEIKSFFADIYKKIKK